MSLTFKFFADAGLTSELATGGDTIVETTDYHDRVIYFGSNATGATLQAASSPGTDPIAIAPDDADEEAAPAVSNIALSLSAVGLDTATPGAALNIGTTVSSGVASAVPIYVRTLRGALTAGTYTGLSLTTNAVVEA